MGKAAVKNSPPKAFHNLRFERKFIYLGITPEDVIQKYVLTNPFCFKEIYTRRSVNNIYFDDLNCSFYKMNVSGDGLREKYRLRWYGDQFEKVTKPIVEVKRKFGLTGDKFSYKVNDLSLELTQDSPREATRKLREHLKNQQLSAKFDLLSPQLYNCYQRRYFLSDCENYRITIDYDMRFYNPQTASFLQSQVQLPDVVLELKYAVELDKESRDLTQGLKVRMSKNSKYVRGCDLVYHLHE
ncbi:MAG: VTC domain-containing protein [Gilvibacter sp.]